MQAGEHAVTFDTGDTTAELNVPILDDINLELDEAFFAEIIGADSEISSGNKVTKVIILNNDGMYLYLGFAHLLPNTSEMC